MINWLIGFKGLLKIVVIFIIAVLSLILIYYLRGKVIKFGDYLLKKCKGGMKKHGREI